MAKRRARGTGPTMIQRSRAVPASDKVGFAMEGAGKSQIRREFFGLTDEDERLITERIEAAIDQALEAS